jgi:long-chain acyl-CoA synthetase
VAEAEASAFHRRFGLSLRQVYGSAVTGAISVNGAPGAGTAPGSIGRPLKGVRVKVVAGGAIAVASPFAATEFLDDPAATAARFRDGFYLSGDIGAKASGGTIAITGWLS